MKSASKFFSLLLILALICFYAIPVLADTTGSTTNNSTDQTTTTDNSTTDQTTTTDNGTSDQTATDKTPTVTDKDNQVAASISKEFNITVTGQDVCNLRVSGMGYGSITIAYAIATASGKSISDITALRQQGLGWGEIAKQLGVKFSDLINKSSKALEKAKLGKEAKELKEQTNQASNKDNNSSKSSNNNGNGSNNGKGSNNGNGSNNGSGKGNGKH